MRNLTLVLWLSLVPAVSAFAVDISDVPLDAAINAAPANVMFLLDDSGSMDWEVIAPESGDGVFNGHEYIFDNPGDNAYTSGSNADILSGDERLWWKSQWFGYNRMYYNPKVTYSPWPTLPAADTVAPRSHPKNSTHTLTLGAPYHTLLSESALVVDNQDGAPAFTVLGGSWYESGASPEYNGSSLYGGSGAVAWQPTLPVAGSYDVWVYYTSRSDFTRDPAAQYTVNYDGGSQAYTVDMNVNYGEWVLLGTHAFVAGTSGSVVLTPSGTPNANAGADAVMFVPTGSIPTVTIPNAHYYVWSESEGCPYLITLAGSIRYYKATVSGSGTLERVTNLAGTTSPPIDVVSGRSYADALQNFANWYSFYRRRELTAAAAVANVINNMAGVQIGISTIHDRINQPVMKIKVGAVDDTSALLNLLYANYQSSGGTPLRRGLQDIGEYFDQTDGGNTGGIGNSPYAGADDGGACQQAFAIVMTDGYWNGSDPFSSDTNKDGDKGPPFADGHANTLADVAMYFYDRDLSNTLANDVPTNSADSNNRQHLVTYGVSFGVVGTIDPKAFDIDDAATYPAWPSPYTNNRHKIDDLFHASVNGRGVFLSAESPDELVESLLEIMRNIEERGASSAPVSVNGEELQEGLRIFQASYNANGWTGDVKAYAVDPVTGNVDTVVPVWSAAEMLASKAPGTRVILTHDGSAAYDGSAGKAMHWANLTTTQKTLLDPTWTTDPTQGSKLVEFLRGSHAYELKNGGPFRDRQVTVNGVGVSKILGDVVHSSPKLENNILYVGANDGMLHAFDAETGEELFAYVPNLVYPNLNQLADPNYAHKFFVDLTPTVQRGVDGDWNGDGNKETKTLLVGGLGKGGMGFYTLDITDLAGPNDVGAESSMKTRALWEYPNAGTPPAELDDIGYTFAQPLVVRSNSDAYPWIVLAGNGYNSPSQKAVLLVLDAVTGRLITKVDTLVAGDNGLSSPAPVDDDGDYKVDHVFAGDLQGNLWKFDFTSSDPTQWKSSYVSGTTPMPLFQATGPGGVPQPITIMPSVMYHCKYGSTTCGETVNDTDPLKGDIVVFGTGRYLGLSDLADTSTQTVYGIWDFGDEEDDSEYLGTFNRSATPQLSNQPENVGLLKQTATWDAVNKRWTMSDATPTWITRDDTDSPNPDPTSSSGVINHAGWYYDLLTYDPVAPTGGQRVDSGIAISRGIATFIGFKPENSTCKAGGTSTVYKVLACSGARTKKPTFDANGDGVIDNHDLGDNGNAPSSFQHNGHLYSPGSVRIGSNTNNYYSSSTGEVKKSLEVGTKYGISSWQEF